MLTASEQREIEHPSLVNALERMFETGQRLVIERLDLARLEAQESIARALRTALMVMIGATIAFAGWLALMAVMVLALRDLALLSTAASIAIVGLVHVVAGGALLIYGLSTPRAAPSAEART